MPKTRKQIIGLKGENFSCDYLLENGFEIVERNYRFKRAEIDIIAKKEKLLIFIEVKTRKNNTYGYPEEFVSNKKIELFREASEEYIESTKWKGNIRFDIVALISKGNSFEIEWLEDAF